MQAQTKVSTSTHAETVLPAIQVKIYFLAIFLEKRRIKHSTQCKQWEQRGEREKVKPIA